MDHKGITLVREKGKDIPELVLTSALLHCGSMVSVAFASAEDGIPQISVMDQNLKDKAVADGPGGALGYVTDLLEGTKDFKIVLHFSNEEKDAQPFTILVNDKQQPTLVAFLVGDFSEHTDTDGHSVEYTEAQEYLTPKILSLYEGVDDDIPKLMNKLREPILSREFSRMGQGDFLNCTILASNGEITCFNSKNSMPVKYDWGHASSELNEHETPAKETEKEVEKVDVPKPLTKIEELKLKAAQRAAAKAEGTPAPKPEAKPEVPAGGKPIPSDTQPATGKPLEGLKAQLQAKHSGKPTIASVEPIQQVADAPRLVPIPDRFSKERDRRGWFANRGMTGEINVDFPDWKTRSGKILVMTSKLKEIHPKLSMDEIQKRFPIASPLDIQQLKGGPLPAKPVTATSVPAVQAAQRASDEGLPIPTNHKATIQDRFLKKPKIVAFTNQKGQNVMNPDFLPQMEDKHPPFWESLGMPSLNSTDWWKRSEYKELGSYSIDALADAAYCEKMTRCRQEKEIIELKAEMAKLKGGPLPSASTEPTGAAAKPLSKIEELKQKAAARKVA